jgi:3-isopropylmalate/(R)-2-methylmalate dehydratase small subunit
MNDLNVLAGCAWVCGDYTDCYQILAPQHWFSGDKVGSLDQNELSRHVMEELDPSFAQAVMDGKYQFIVSGKNFGGGGKSIEHPVIAIKGLGVKAIIADSISRYFFRNSINNGLVVIATNRPFSRSVKTGDELRVDLNSGEIVNLTSGAEVQTAPLVGIVREILNTGGYINYTKTKMSQSRSLSKSA